MSKTKIIEIIGGFEVNDNLDPNEIINKIIDFAEENGWYFFGTINTRDKE